MSYAVVVTREGGSWLADVPSVAGAHTFARSLEGLIKSVREVVVLMDELAVRDAELRSATAEMVRELGGRGYAVRDTARLLAMTPGRVSQLANA